MPELALLSGEEAEEPRRRKRSLVTLTLAVTLAAAAGAAAIWTLGYYIAQLIAHATAKG